jgi:integrase
LKPSTVKSYKSMVKTHLRPAFGGYRSDRLTAEVVSDWERKMAEAIADGKLTPKSFNHLVALLHSILGWARKRGQRYLAHDPLTDVARLRTESAERRFLEPGQITALLEAAEEPARTILYVAVNSGLRRGELFALQWSDVDEQHHQLRVRRSIYQGAVTRPKTKHSERTVDVIPHVITVLKEYQKRYTRTDSDYIFHTDIGTPLDPDNWFKRWFVPIAVKAGLRPARDDDANGEQLVGLHTLRHHADSRIMPSVCSTD